MSPNWTPSTGLGTPWWTEDWELRDVDVKGQAKLPPDWELGDDDRKEHGKSKDNTLLWLGT